MVNGYRSQTDIYGCEVPTMHNPNGDSEVRLRIGPGLGSLYVDSTVIKKEKHVSDRFPGQDVKCISKIVSPEKLKNKQSVIGRSRI